MADESAQSVLEIAGLEPYEEKPGEEFMSPRMKSHFTSLLVCWRNKLREQVDRTLHEMQDFAISGKEFSKEQDEEFSKELEARDSERRLVKEIEKTLNKMEEDDFGFCESCGADINIRRLEADPTTKKTVECQELEDIKNKQMQ